jgi:hypothetical protein
VGVDQVPALVVVRPRKESGPIPQGQVQRLPERRPGRSRRPLQRRRQPSLQPEVEHVPAGPTRIPPAGAGAR